jgi:hypothetical protein
MNTLKLKVLLLFSNKHLGWSISRSLLIWIFTCFTGSAIHCGLYNAFPLPQAFVLSLLFSSPVLLLAMPTLYALPFLPSISSRLGISSTVILVACSTIIGFVSIFFNLPFEAVAVELFPFLPAAMACYYIITRKQLLKKFISYKTYKN